MKKFESIKCPMCNENRFYNKNSRFVICTKCHLKLGIHNDGKLEFNGFTGNVMDEFTEKVAIELATNKVDEYNKRIVA